jgi:hypothetical protein
MMFDIARPGRDAFTFSLSGMAAINSYAIAPAVPNDCINRAWDRRLAGAGQDSMRLVLRIEDALARYFAPGHCKEA